MLNGKKYLNSPTGQKRGFTLLEIMVVLFVISLGMVGVLSLIIQNIQAQSYNKNNLIAYQLAQEGVELIRKVRDSNWKQSLPYNTNLADGQYYMDYLDNVPTLCNPNDHEQAEKLVLKQDENGFYFNESLTSTGVTTSSGFSRLITIRNIDAKSLQVTVKVSWKEKGRDSSYILDTYLYDWK